MSRLFADENFPWPVVEALRLLGYDVLTLQESGHGGQAMPDDAVLAFAAAERRAVLTLNRKHFIRLHTEVAAHAGIVVCTFDPDFDGQAARIDAAITAQGSLEGILMRVNRPPR
jgi:hypothetical protein